VIFGFRIASAAFFAFPLILSGCLGGSDGVENPKFEVEMRSQDGAAPLAGRIAVYVKDQNPMRDSVPLLEMTVPANGKAAFTPQQVDAAIAAKLKALCLCASPAIGPDTLLEFNLVAVSGSREALAGKYGYRRAANRAGFADLSAVEADKAGFGSITQSLRLGNAVTDYPGKVGGRGLTLGIDYLFVRGSPYKTEITGNAFAFPRLSTGIFEVVGVDRDSSAYFRSLDSLDTGAPEFSARDWEGIIFLE